MQAYVRGAKCGCADRSGFENSTAVFTKRRHREISYGRHRPPPSQTSNCLQLPVPDEYPRQETTSYVNIKARVRAKGQRGSNWYGEKRVEYLRRKCRTSNLWLLQLSGDFHPSFETEPIVDLEKHHMMRAMLTANLAVDQRFANGPLLLTVLVMCAQLCSLSLTLSVSRRMPRYYFVITVVLLRIWNIRGPKAVCCTGALPSNPRRPFPRATPK